MLILFIHRDENIYQDGRAVRLHKRYDVILMFLMYKIMYDILRFTNNDIYNNNCFKN